VAVPILLITGFLGAGKTTLINHLLTEPNGRRLAAVVNDFGAIDIDAALLASVGDDIVSLKNGCICCSLQGDLLRTLSTLLRRDPAPDGIVIETSGVSDPAEIVRSLLDPVIWQAAALDAVICVADARHLTDRPDLLNDGLCQSQLRAADFVALNKAGQVSAAELATVRQALTKFKPSRVIQDTADGRMPPDLLFSAGLHQPETARPAGTGFATPGFESVSWTAASALSLPRFQAVIGRLAGRLLRAKGFVIFADQPGRPMVFQLVGDRATIAPAPPSIPIAEPVRLVFIARNGAVDEEELRANLSATIA
jgi:G3E family GTPase